MGQLQESADRSYEIAQNTLKLGNMVTTAYGDSKREGADQTATVGNGSNEEDKH